jgi:hypothetical protein
MLLSGCSKPEERSIEIQGDLTGRHYTNAHFGLDFQIPDSWDLVTEGIGGRTAELANQRTPQMESELKSVRPQIEYVLKALRKSEAAPGEPWLQFTVAIHHGGATKGLRTSELYAERFIQDVTHGVEELKIIDPISTVWLNGTEYVRVRYYARAKDMSINQSIYFRALGDDVLTLAAYYGSKQHLHILSSVIREADKKG